MRLITRDTITALLMWLTPKQKEELEKLGYTQADMESADSFYAALVECPRCETKDKEILALRAEKNMLQSTREYFDFKFGEVAKAINKEEIR